MAPNRFAFPHGRGRDGKTHAQALARLQALPLDRQDAAAQTLLRILPALEAEDMLSAPELGELDAQLAAPDDDASAEEAADFFAARRAR
jgi:hypothetical protein